MVIVVKLRRSIFLRVWKKKEQGEEKKTKEGFGAKENNRCCGMRDTVAPLSIKTGRRESQSIVKSTIGGIYL